MKTKIYIIVLTLISSLSYANICGDWFAKKGTQIKEAVAEVKVPEVDFSSVENVKDQVTALLEESLKQCGKGVGVALRFCGHSAVQAIPIAYRVIRFEPSIDKFREEVAYPLADMLMKMKDPQFAGKESEKAHFNFLLFWPELILKVQKCIPQQVAEVGFNAVTGLLTVNEKINPGIMSEVRKQIQKTIMKKFWYNLKSNEDNKDMSFIQRLKFATSEAIKWEGDMEMQAVVDELVQQMGFDRLQEALALYRDNE